MGKFWINCLLALPCIFYFGFGSGHDVNRPNSRDYRIAAGVKELDPSSAHFLDAYGAPLRKYSQRYGLDWRFVLAVMRIESRFHTKASSYSGAEGLMQIMPVTQSQIAGELGLRENAFRTPHANIRGGIYYLGKLYRQLGSEKISPENRLRLTLAAYNAGPARIADARMLTKYLNDDPNEWGAVKASLPLLNRKYSSLHSHVWDEGRPASGYYRQWQQTTDYVDAIMSCYAEYCRIIPENV